MNLANPLRELTRGHYITDPPAGDTEGLGETVNHQSPVPHPGQGDNSDVFLPFIEDVIVDFVGNGEAVPLLAQICN